MQQNFFGEHLQRITFINCFRGVWGILPYLPSPVSLAAPSMVKCLPSEVFGLSGILQVYLLQVKYFLSELHVALKQNKEIAYYF
jgi:hypothetical protein